MGPKLLLLFIVGDILGTGVYALTGKVASEVGGAVWLPFLCAFIVAILTAFSYLELVTKYPQAAGAALYTHKAFGLHFLTFMVTFTVMCSGLTSASSASKAFAANFVNAFDIGWSVDGGGVLAVALCFILLVALVNYRGVGESVKANVVLTLVELSGLLIIIFIGLVALGQGKGEPGRLLEFAVPEGESPFMAVTAATALAFFAMVGFEDSVNMAEETKNPSKIFPKMMLLGLSITGVIYILVSISSVALVAPAELGEGDAPLLKVVAAGAPAFPIIIFAFITMFAVANSALINMLMASRLLYGMAKQGVLPYKLSAVHRSRRTPWVAIVVTTALAVGLIAFSDLEALGGTTSLLLLAVFSIVNITVLVLRKDPVDHDHFRTPTIIPILGFIFCAYLVTPLSGRAAADYKVAGVLLAVGLVLWLFTWMWRVASHRKGTESPSARFEPK
ncbi:APC family permease [Saxibacter everestensis]|uniref:APC family permease n=2 Tax=Saxibacter everestensis TaxID=2909229 RepID=A0ABY8R0S7_9MICO|nr:APC family permease [Brevibacteriaceae bacterium ZFBP1038]